MRHRLRLLDAFLWCAVPGSPREAGDRIADLLRPSEDITLKILRLCHMRFERPSVEEMSFLAPETRIWNTLHSGDASAFSVLPASPSQCGFCAGPFGVGSSTIGTDRS